MASINLSGFNRKVFNQDQQGDVNTQVIDDVMGSIRQPFLEAGIEGSVLDILSNLWRQKLQIRLDEEEASSDDEDAVVVVEASSKSSRGEDSTPSVDFGVFRLPQLDGHADELPASRSAAATVLASKLSSVKCNKKKRFTKKLKRVHHVEVVAKPETGARPKSTNPILLAAVGPVGAEAVESEKSKKKRKKKVLQLDGLNDTSDSESDDLDNDDDDNDDDDDDDDDDPLGEDEEDEGAEEDPLGSGDDISDEDPSDLFNTENVVVCQYEKITRARNKWKFHLKDGIMNLNGRDYVFQRANGEAEW